MRLAFAGVCNVRRVRSFDLLRSEHAPGSVLDGFPMDVRAFSLFILLDDTLQRRDPIASPSFNSR